MTKPTPAQIEAALNAYADVLNAHPAEGYAEAMSAAITAAAEVGEPTLTRKDLGWNIGDSITDNFVKKVEAITIERCAQVVWDAGGDNVEFHIAAIRASKDKAGADPNLVYPGKDADFVFPEE